MTYNQIYKLAKSQGLSDDEADDLATYWEGIPRKSLQVLIKGILEQNK